MAREYKPNNGMLVFGVMCRLCYEVTGIRVSAKQPVIGSSPHGNTCDHCGYAFDNASTLLEQWRNYTFDQNQDTQAQVSTPQERGANPTT